MIPPPLCSSTFCTHCLADTIDNYKWFVPNALPNVESKYSKQWEQKGGRVESARESFMIPTVDGEGTSVSVNVKESEFTTALT